MQQGTDRRSDANPRETRLVPPARPSEPDPRTGRKARPSAAPGPQSFTSKMLEYRSWWNLPGPKARKIHG